MTPGSRAPSPWLPVIAAIGATVPNGLFIAWLIRDFNGISAVLADRLALAFILDAAMATGLLCWLFAVRPLGPLRWPWFLVMSLAGGLGFSIPAYFWLNRRMQPAVHDAAGVSGANPTTSSGGAADESLDMPRF